jgi:hypothetical protein
MTIAAALPNRTARQNGQIGPKYNWILIIIDGCNTVDNSISRYGVPNAIAMTRNNDALINMIVATICSNICGQSNDAQLTQIPTIINIQLNMMKITIATSANEPASNST